jgi:hypothetical protein
MPELPAKCLQYRLREHIQRDWRSDAAKRPGLSIRNRLSSHVMQDQTLALPTYQEPSQSGFLATIKYIGVNKPSLPPATSASAPADNSTAVSADPKGANLSVSIVRKRIPTPILPTELIRKTPKKSPKVCAPARSPARGAYQGLRSAIGETFRCARSPSCSTTKPAFFIASSASFRGTMFEIPLPRSIPKRILRWCSLLSS